MGSIINATGELLDIITRLRTEKMIPLEAARRVDLTTIAIAPYPAGYEDDHLKCFIANTRAHYGDQLHPLCDTIIVGFSKTMSTILKHDPKDFKSTRVREVDKSNWPSGIILPIDDFCCYMGRLLHFTLHFDSRELCDVFHRCLPDCPLRDAVTWQDWEQCRIPQGFKWLAICAFEKPRIAKFCSTKYEVGTDNVCRIVVDQVIGITAIQGHPCGESANNLQLLGWTKVDQAFTGVHIPFDFHKTSTKTLGTF